MQVMYEATPNPQSLKFVVTQQITGESRNFASQSETGSSPLAAKIFGFPWAAGVFIGPNFVTVTKQDWVSWEVLADPLSDLIAEHLERGEPVFSKNTPAEDSQNDSANDSHVVKQIKQILNAEIRPAVAMDGGDIVFHSFEDGRVFLRMQGACAGCPSSTFTLKEGIETRLKEAIPEVIEVVSI